MSLYLIFFFLFISGPASQLICFQYSIIGFLLDMFWIHGFYVKSLNNGPHISCLINQMYGREAWFLSSHGQGGQFIFCFHWNQFTHWGNVFWVKWNLCHPLLLGLPSSIILGFSFGSPETPLWYLAPDTEQSTASLSPPQSPHTNRNPIIRRSYQVPQTVTTPSYTVSVSLWDGFFRPNMALSSYFDIISSTETNKTA